MFNGRRSYNRRQKLADRSNRRGSSPTAPSGNDNHQPTQPEKSVQEKLLEETDNPALKDLVQEVIRW